MPRGRTYSPEFKAKLMLEILCEDNTISQIGAREKISPKLLGNWKKEFLENAYRAFSVSKDEKEAKNALKEREMLEHELLAKIGQLTYERDWLKKKYSEYGGMDKSKNARQERLEAFCAATM